MRARTKIEFTQVLVMHSEDAEISGAMVYSFVGSLDDETAINMTFDAFLAEEAEAVAENGDDDDETELSTRDDFDELYECSVRRFVIDALDHEIPFIHEVTNATA